MHKKEWDTEERYMNTLTTIKAYIQVEEQNIRPPPQTAYYLRPTRNITQNITRGGLTQKDRSYHSPSTFGTAKFSPRHKARYNRKPPETASIIGRISRQAHCEKFRGPEEGSKPYADVCLATRSSTGQVLSDPQFIGKKAQRKAPQP